MTVNVVCTSRVVRVSPVLGRYLSHSTCGPSSVTSVCITMYPIIGHYPRGIVNKAAVVYCPSAHCLMRDSKSTGLRRPGFIAAKICDAQSAAKAPRSAHHGRKRYSEIPNVYRLHFAYTSVKYEPPLSRPHRHLLCKHDVCDEYCRSLETGVGHVGLIQYIQL